MMYFQDLNAQYMPARQAAPETNAIQGDPGLVGSGGARRGGFAYRIPSLKRTPLFSSIRSTVETANDDSFSTKDSSGVDRGSIIDCLQSNPCQQQLFGPEARSLFLPSN
jgi:hypothetical protein